MFSISQTGKMVGVARSTLLYYERIGLIAPRRNPENDYRYYTGDDIGTLILIRHLQRAGFSLREASEIMNGRLDSNRILSRYRSLEKKVQELATALEVVKSLVNHATGEEPSPLIVAGPAERWHAELEETAGDAHAQWLGRLGFNEKEQFYIRWVTRSLTNSEQYMKAFFLVFERMKRQGPGSPAATIRAFEAIPDNQRIRSVLEVGCGKGQSALTLAAISRARITAIDNHQPFLDHLAEQTASMGLDDRIEIRNLSMADMATLHGPFDLIWSEGTAYFLGFAKALTAWKPLIRADGYLFVTDAVWLTDAPSRECEDYFRIEYPCMASAETRKRECLAAGYDVISHWILPSGDWAAFYDDMETCVHQAAGRIGMTPAYEKMLQEVAIGRAHGDEYGAVCLLLRPVSGTVPSAIRPQKRNQ